jgi:Centromere DNA-binding protein complex CBF3 subunit, domain 2
MASSDSEDENEDPPSEAEADEVVVTTTEADVAERTREHAVANALRVSTDSVDASYKREWKNFKQWFAEQVVKGLLLPSAGKFLTRANVDAYFTEVVVNRKVAPTTARRVVSALQTFADREEYADCAIKFKVDDSTFVVNALKNHYHLYVERVTKETVDPHANLPTDMLTADDIRKVLTHVLGQSNWKDFSTCWNVCENTFLRCDSMLKLCFCDLIIDFTHGPVQSGPNSRMLGIVLRKKAHKDRSNRTRVVGTWRSRDYLRCTTGMLAFNTFFTFFDHSTLNFYKGTVNPKSKPSWQNIKIISGWSSTKAVDRAYQAVYKACGVGWKKSTHLRTLGIEHASAAGCQNDELGTMSKHLIDKIDRYTTELYPPLLKVMARFAKDEDYWVPRLFLEPPSNVNFTEHDLLKCLWPKIDDWRAQQEGSNGDGAGNECAAFNFLWKVLPYFAQVIFQDGIYWLRDFPDNPATRLLIDVMPDWYEEWAVEARDKVEEMIKHREESKVTDLNTAVQAAFSALSNKMDAMDAGQEQMNAKIDALASELRLQIAGLRLGVAQQDEPSSVVGQQVARGAQQDKPSSFATVVDAVAPLRVSLSPVTMVSTTDSTLHPAVQLPPPVFPKDMPKSMEALLQEHRIYKLDAWAGPGVPKKHWPQGVEQGFSRRMFFYKRIHAQASRFRNPAEDFQTGKMPRAAAELDKMRAGRSLTKFGDDLRRNDPEFKQRKKRKLQA